MGKNYDRDSGDERRSKQLIEERQEELEAVLDLFTSNAADVNLTPPMKREIATRIMNFWRVLSVYEDEAVLSDDDIPDVAPIQQRLGRETRIVTDAPGRDRGKTYQTVPAVDELDYWYLYNVASQLESMAKKLGVWGDMKTKKPIYNAGKRESYADPVVEGIPKPQTGQDGDGITDFRYSRLYHEWYQRVASGDPNDYIIAVSADPRTTGVSGTGKTTLGGGLAKRWFDYSEGGFDAEVQYTLDPAVLAYEMYDETDELAVLVGDEMQGTPATTGLNAKRSQKNEALATINAIAAGRSDRKTVILIVQDLKSLNKDALTFIDAWLLIRDDYDYVATHYEVAPNVYELGNRKTKTPAVEQITWDPLPKDDPDYEAMEQKKAQAKQGQREYSDGQGDNEEVSRPKELRDRDLRYDWKNFDVTQKELAEKYGINQSTVSKILNNNA